MIEAVINARLNATTELTALVEDRIFPVVPEQDTTVPLVVFTVVDSAPYLTLSGPTNLVSSQVQIDSWSVNFDTAKAVSDAVNISLSGYRGGSIQGSILTSQSTQEEEVGFHVIQSYTVFANV